MLFASAAGRGARGEGRESTLIGVLAIQIVLHHAGGDGLDGRLVGCVGAKTHQIRTADPPAPWDSFGGFPSLAVEIHNVDPAQRHSGDPRLDKRGGGSEGRSEVSRKQSRGAEAYAGSGGEDGDAWEG